MNLQNWSIIVMLHAFPSLSRRKTHEDSQARLIGWSLAARAKFGPLSA